jgi:putative transcriptional regulator
MEDQFFDNLLKSVSEAGEILNGKRKPSRTFNVDATSVREIRESLALSQRQFASIVHVSVKTLRNWEQGVRTPDGAAAALLTAIRNDPKNVLAALNAGGVITN